MEGILIVLAILIGVVIARKFPYAAGRRGSLIIKSKPTTKKPEIEPAPQSKKRNKYGRTEEEQELHEWLEDNPR